MVERDLVGLYARLAEAFGRRVHAVRTDQWTAWTPCASWDVAALVAHQTAEHHWVDPLLRGLNLERAAAEVDARQAADGDLVAMWDEAAAESVAAFRAEGALRRPVFLTRGRTMADGYLRELIFDLTIHGWDLDRAIGFPDPLPCDIVTAVWDESRQFTDLSASGMFDTPVDVPDDASVLDRLIALTGRDPSWSPPGG